jgi:Holliday junction resolvasome RuvABC ATP-dependent DNA helicase subunit
MSDSALQASKDEGMEAGVQPLDGLLSSLGLSNHDLVAAAGPGLLSHKMVAKARRGRKLTMRLQEKITRALNTAARREKPIRRDECFNYRGR